MSNMCGMPIMIFAPSHSYRNKPSSTLVLQQYIIFLNNYHKKLCKITIQNETKYATTNLICEKREETLIIFVFE